MVVERVRLGEPCLDSATEVDKTTLDGKWSGRGSPTSRWFRSDRLWTMGLQCVGPKPSSFRITGKTGGAGDVLGLDDNAAS